VRLGNAVEFAHVPLGLIPEVLNTVDVAFEGVRVQIQQPQLKSTTKTIDSLG
jgi:hypothetical protein